MPFYSAKDGKRLSEQALPQVMIMERQRSLRTEKGKLLFLHIPFF